MAKTLKDFIQDLKQDAWREKVGPNLAMLEPGNINGLISYASSLGYELNAEEVSGFFTSLVHPEQANEEQKEIRDSLCLDSSFMPNTLLKNWMEQLQIK